jgi:PBP1b-binding outer membrane lipoprotein LpoB
MKRLSAFLFISLWLVGCSGPAGEPDEKKLEQRASEIEADANNAVNSAISDIDPSEGVDEIEGDEPAPKASN